jgi:hypothetical protein
MSGELVHARPASRVIPTISRRASRQLLSVSDETSVRVARVQGESIVQTEKVHEIGHLTREAMTGFAMLRKWGDTLATGDVFMADDMKFFTDMAKLSMGEIIADTSDTYCRESRGL